MKMDYFPYEYRPGQKELVSFIDRTVRDSRCAVIEAGTGTGKTITSLCGVLGYAKDHDMKIVYLTRTKSQQKQVIRESAAIGNGILCVAVQGRSAASCPMMRDDPDLASGNAEEISKLCSVYKRKSGGVCHCKFYSGIEETDVEQWVEIIRQQYPDPEDFSRMCEDAGICPYELMKLILPYADIIAVPYPFVFMPMVLDRFVEWMGVPLSRTILIVDEAHNLPDYLRDVQTFEYSEHAMDLAAKEAKEHGDFELHEGITVTDLVAVLKEILAHAEKEYLIDEDGMLPPYFLEDELMSRLGVSSVTISRMCKSMEEIGDGIMEKKKERKKLPRSYIHSMSRFIRAWIDGDEDNYVRLIVKEKDNPLFQAYCMDPSGAAGPLIDCFSSIHMSGTLQPLDAYETELGLDRVNKLCLDGIFPKENLLTLYTDKVSMKYEERELPQNYDTLMQMIVDCVNAVRVNTAIFFPSYGFMDKMVDDGLVRYLNRDVVYEQRGMSQPELMSVFENFKTSDGGVLFCVTGGRISEGLDFPDKSLEMAILIGIPYPKPTAKMRAMRRYYDIRFGDGMKYTSTIPTVRKMRQSIGRLIRSETDRGVAIIMDRRVAGLKDIDAELCQDIPSKEREFFRYSKYDL
ncbi:MAG: ATP-dependent DNA helicase [Candidatus Methanomethylophilaceae archaeon]|nr:ATP-dependent DNA helicase [Candidatus Methanomethylophilaceae archaeon]